MVTRHSGTRKRIQGQSLTFELDENFSPAGFVPVPLEAGGRAWRSAGRAERGVTVRESVRAPARVLLAQGLSGFSAGLTLAFSSCFNSLSAFFLSVPVLQEIRQLQQKQASYIREISDLQETIEWKDKKIGVGLSSLSKSVPGQSA